MWNPDQKTRLQFGPYPHQYLDVDTADYNIDFKTDSSLPTPAQTGMYEFVLSKGFWALVIIGAVILGVVGLLYVYGVPVLSEQVAQQIPAAQETELGESLYQQLKSRGEVTENPAQTKRLTAFWQQTGIKTRVPLRIVVVNDADTNAFAVPGGRVVVYSGILKLIKRPEQLAALLAHEAAHIENRHSLQQLIRSLAAYAIVSILIGDQGGGMSAILVQNADNLISLSYSRQHEAEADAFAVTELAKHGLNPMGAVWLMEALPTNGDVIPTLLRSHPHNAERVAATRTLARKTHIQLANHSRLTALSEEILKAAE